MPSPAYIAVARVASLLGVRPSILSAFAGAMALANKGPADPLSMRRFSLVSAPDLGGKLCAAWLLDLGGRDVWAGGGAVGAAALPLWSFVLLIPPLLYWCLLRHRQGRRGRFVQESGPAASSALAGGQVFQCRDRGWWQAGLLLLPRRVQLGEAIDLGSGSAPGYFPADKPQSRGLGRLWRRAISSVQKAASSAMMCS